MIRRASSFVLVLLVLYSCRTAAQVTGYGVARQSTEELSALISKWEKSLLPEEDDAPLSVFWKPQDRALHPEDTLNNDLRAPNVDFEIVPRAQVEVALDPTVTEIATSEITEPPETTRMDVLETVIPEASVTEETEVFIETAVSGTETPTENPSIPSESGSEQPSPTALDSFSTESSSTLSFTQATEVFLDTATFVVETETFVVTVSATATPTPMSFTEATEVVLETATFVVETETFFVTATATPTPIAGSGNPAPTSTPSSSTEASPTTTPTPTSGSSSTPTRTPTRTPAGQAGSVVAVVRLDFSYEAWLADDENLTAVFVSEMAAQLGVAERRVAVVSVTNGSTIVTCAVAPQTSGSTAAQSAIVSTLTSSTFTLPSFDVLSVSASIESTPTGNGGGSDGGGSAASSSPASFTLLALCLAVLFALSSAL